MFKVSFTGHRPHKLSDPSAVKLAIRQFLVTQHALHPDLLVISGGALGVDQFAADICIDLDIPFVFILPFPVTIMSARWPARSTSHLLWLIKHAVRSYITSHEFSMAAYQLRNEAMVDHCDLLCAVFNGSPGGTSNCVRYAQQVNKPVHTISP